MEGSCSVLLSNIDKLIRVPMNKEFHHIHRELHTDFFIEKFWWFTMSNALLESNQVCKKYLRFFIVKYNIFQYWALWATQVWLNGFFKNKIDTSHNGNPPIENMQV